MASMTYIVTLHLAGKACKRQTLNLIEPICKSGRKKYCVYLAQGTYSQHLIVLKNYEWSQQPRLLYYNRLYMPARDKHTILMSLFES